MLAIESALWDFCPGYENRRINVTVLLGYRCAHAAKEFGKGA